MVTVEALLRASPRDVERLARWLGVPRPHVRKIALMRVPHAKLIAQVHRRNMFIAYVRAVARELGL
jgi:hypothetical protein